jgi:signal transduction histidine kinase
MDIVLRRITNVGVQESMSRSQARGIVLANMIALIASVLAAVYLAFWLRNGWSRHDLTITLAIGILLSVIAWNRAGYVNFGRLLLTLTIPLTCLYFIFYARVQSPLDFDYKPTPAIYCLLLSSAVIPLLVCSNTEKKLLWICVVLNFLLFASFDIFLRAFSKLQEMPSVVQYFSSNLSLLISYFLLLGSVMSLKRINDKYEASNADLIEQLNSQNQDLEKSNRELHELYKNIETQNEEIQAQSEELMQSQDNLMMAHSEIERQKQELIDQNKFLIKSLDEKNRDLLNSNQQLITQNNELQQFSYTLSHNMRGPVASLLGLVNIHRLAPPEEQTTILTLIEQSALSLETIIRDLNKVIDIRNDKFSVFETVCIETELTLIQKSLQGFIDSNHVTIETDFQHGPITSIKAYINSILYNLISNAIQYRSPERKPLIQVATRLKNNHLQLEVSDNGLGIDLSKFKSDIFKLYKRFHTHTQGKGLGLYLIKQQIEKLNGTIEVTSTPDAGASFYVLLPLKQEA